MSMVRAPSGPALAAAVPRRRVRMLARQLLDVLKSSPVSGSASGLPPPPPAGATRVRVGVVEAPPDLVPGEQPWQVLCKKTAAQNLEFLCLNELFAGSWLSIIHPDEITQKTPGLPDKETQKAQSREVHALAVERLGDFQVGHIGGSRSQWEEGKTINEAFVYSSDSKAIRGYHSKQFLPDDNEYFEAHWYDRGQPKFELAEAGPLRIGFMICTECFFNETARRYRQMGANLIVVPRATPSVPRVTEQFKTACKMAAIMSGCFVLSSNRAYGPDRNGVTYGGAGWIIHPSGEVIAETSPENPVVAAEIDLDEVFKFQHRYPNYVAELGQNPKMKKIPIPAGRSGRGYIVVPEEEGK